eukprot:8248_1
MHVWLHVMALAIQIVNVDQVNGDDCICTREYDPLCCAGVDYSSPCVERCDDDDLMCDWFDWNEYHQNIGDITRKNDAFMFVVSVECLDIIKSARCAIRSLQSYTKQIFNGI